MRLDHFLIAGISPAPSPGRTPQSVQLHAVILLPSPGEPLPTLHRRAVYHGEKSVPQGAGATGSRRQC